MLLLTVELLLTVVLRTFSFQRVVINSNLNSAVEKAKYAYLAEYYESPFSTALQRVIISLGDSAHSARYCSDEIFYKVYFF